MCNFPAVHWIFINKYSNDIWNINTHPGGSAPWMPKFRGSQFMFVLPQPLFCFLFWCVFLTFGTFYKNKSALPLQNLWSTVHSYYYYYYYFILYFNMFLNIFCKHVFGLFLIDYYMCHNVCYFLTQNKM